MAEDDQPTIKVTDRRMFTETGELREGFEEESSGASEEPTEPASAPETPRPNLAEPAAGAGGPGPGRDHEHLAGEAPSAAPIGAPPEASSVPAPEVREAPPGYGEAQMQPRFLDLVAMLAEPAALFLGDATMPGQEPMEDLDRARMHIDLLAVLESKCQGNLDEQEQAVLGDLVYRLRMRYVEKRG